MANENTSQDFICAEVIEDNFEDYSPAFTTTASVVQVLFFFVLLVGGVTLNGLVLVLTKVSKDLRTPSFLVAHQVVCFDLVVAVVSSVSVISTSIGGRWVLGWHLCAITGFLLTFAGLMRTLLIALLSVDRFLSVFVPYWYPKRHKALLSILSLVAWLVAMSFSLLALPGIFDCYGYQYLQKVCFSKISCNEICYIYGLIYWIAFVAPACFVPVILYSCLYYKVKQIQRRMPENGRKYINNKAAITYFIIFLTALLLTLPVHILIAVIDALVSSETSKHILKIFGSIISAFIVITDPIFILRNEDAKIALKKLNCAKIAKRKTRS